MKLKSSFITHEVANEHITVSTCSTEFAGLIRSNPTAALIIEALKQETSPEVVANSICKEFDVEYQRAFEDVLKVIKKLKEIGAIDE